MKKMILLVYSMLIILFTSCEYRSENNPYDNNIAVPRTQTNQISQSITKMLLNNPDLTVIMVTHHLNDETKNFLNGVLSLA